jgi:hypothetical protein
VCWHGRTAAGVGARGRPYPKTMTAKERLAEVRQILAGDINRISHRQLARDRYVPCKRYHKQRQLAVTGPSL